MGLLGTHHIHLHNLLAGGMGGNGRFRGATVIISVLLILVIIISISLITISQHEKFDHHGVDGCRADFRLPLGKG